MAEARRDGSVAGASRDSRLRGNDNGGRGLLVEEIATVTSFPRNDKVINIGVRPWPKGKKIFVVLRVLRGSPSS